MSCLVTIARHYAIGCHRWIAATTRNAQPIAPKIKPERTFFRQRCDRRAFRQHPPLPPIDLRCAALLILLQLECSATYNLTVDLDVDALGPPSSALELRLYM